MSSARRISTVATLLCALIGMHASAAAEETLFLDGLHVAVWRPSGSGRHPLIVFSHGLHGCSTQSGFILQSFAEAGYLVLAPDHRDSGCRGGADEPLQAPLREPLEWSDRTYRDRADDVQRVVRAVSADTRLSGIADVRRIGLVGHSLGGYTMLGLAGAWASWHLEHVKAVLGLSPYLSPYVMHGTLSELRVPVMYQGGTLDEGLTPAVRRPDGGYDQSPRPKYYVELEGAGHFAWTDIGLSDRAPILTYSIAFMNRYVKGEGDGAVLQDTMAGVAVLRAEP